MQTKKDNIHQSILIIAKETFLIQGFKNTSMRNIAKKSNVSLSNIYNYFRNKDEIYVAVLSPLLLVIDAMFKNHNNDENLSLENFISSDYQAKSIKMMVDLVENYRNELKLLLFHSYGSTLENFRDDYTNKYTEITIEYLARMKKKYPHLNTKISEFFIHTLGAWMFSIIGEIVSHNNLNHKEIEDFMSDFITYGTAGWKEIMKI